MAGAEACPPPPCSVLDARVAQAMIRKLQVAKAAAEMRDSGQMEAVAGVR